MSDSRVEDLLDALLNGTEPAQEPKSRVEAYLYALCKQGMKTQITDEDIIKIADLIKESGELPGSSVTIKETTESDEDGGSNVVTFSDGTTLTIKNGSTGTPGENGEDGTSVYYYNEYLVIDDGVTTLAGGMTTDSNNTNNYANLLAGLVNDLDLKVGDLVIDVDGVLAQITVVNFPASSSDRTTFKVKALTYVSSTMVESALPFYDKTLIAYGTSITYSCDLEENEGGYLEQLKSLCGFSTVVNNGWSGRAMANGTANGDGINYKIRNTDFTSADVITIEMATNDFKLNVNIGSVLPIGSSGFDTSTFAGALQDSIEYILSITPETPIVLIADPQRDNDGYDIYYTNTAGYKLIDYINAAGIIADLYGLPICDLYHNGGFNDATFSTFTIGDNLHPNLTGYKRLAITIAGTINSMNGRIISANDDDSVSPETLTINDVTYDVTLAKGYPYRFVMQISGNNYLYYSKNRLYIKINSNGSISEVYTIDDTLRAKDSNNTFTSVVSFAMKGSTLQTPPYYTMTGAERSLDDILWSSHNLVNYDTGDILITGDVQ